jgi:AcrR family transcriptional regulator
VTDHESQGYRRPWRLPRGRHGLSPETVARSQRERLIAGMVRVVAVKGYESTSVANVLEASGVGRSTFYELFESKEDCFLTAHQLLVDDLFAHTLGAFRGPGSWPERIREALAALLEWLAADPDIARVTLFEIASIGPAARRHFGAALDNFASLLDEGRELGEPGRPLPNLSGIAAGTIFARIYGEVILGRTVELPELLPVLTFEVLLPFVGDSVARDQQNKARMMLLPSRSPVTRDG